MIKKHSVSSVPLSSSFLFDSFCLFQPIAEAALPWGHEEEEHEVLDWEASAGSVAASTVSYAGITTNPCSVATLPHHHLVKDLILSRTLASGVLKLIQFTLHSSQRNRCYCWIWVSVSCWLVCVCFSPIHFYFQCTWLNTFHVGILEIFGGSCALWCSRVVHFWIKKGDLYHTSYNKVIDKLWSVFFVLNSEWHAAAVHPGKIKTDPTLNWNLLDASFHKAYRRCFFLFIYLQL